MLVKLYNILLIDDSINNLHVISNMLDKDKYRVFKLQSAKEALQFIEENEIPDIILLDIMMPGMDGFTFKRKLNNNPLWRKIPVIVISALAEQDNKIIAFDLGCVDYMVKPIYRKEVISRINVQIEAAEYKAELQKMNFELKSANTTRDKIFSIISHDLRTSIGNISNVFKFMVDGLIDVEEDKDLIIDAEITSRNTYNLLDNLLFWAKSQQGQIIPKPELVNVSRIVSGILDMEKRLILNKGIKCLEDIDSDLFVWTDKVLFIIIIRNLIANAIKFSNENGEIKISVVKQGDFIKLSVIDNGVGISSANLMKIRNKTMLTTTGTLNEKGTGIGLMLVSDFVLKSKGKFDIKSVEGKGSKFSVSLPIEEVSP